MTCFNRKLKLLLETYIGECEGNRDALRLQNELTAVFATRSRSVSCRVKVHLLIFLNTHKIRMNK